MPSAFDVVCGMELTPDRVQHSHEHRGELYYFCSENCYEHFIVEPERYLGVPK